MEIQVREKFNQFWRSKVVKIYLHWIFHASVDRFLAFGSISALGADFVCSSICKLFAWEWILDLWELILGSWGYFQASWSGFGLWRSIFSSGILAEVPRRWVLVFGSRFNYWGSILGRYL